MKKTSRSGEVFLIGFKFIQATKHFQKHESSANNKKASPFFGEAFLND